MKHGADLEAREGGGGTPLHLASENPEALDVTRELLRLGADANAKDGSGGTALTTALARDEHEKVDLLLSFGARHESFGRPWRRAVVHDRKEEKTPGQPAADVANFGLVRPPIVYLGSIALGLLVHLFWPAQFLPSSVGVPVGILLVLVAGALFISAVRTLRKAGTPIPGNRPTTTIVRAGPYSFSRNPIYLAFTLFQASVAAGVNSLAVLLTLLPALALMALVVIPREERYLGARFPSEYLPYKRAVRRWL